MSIYSIKKITESNIDKHADDWEEDSNSELIGNDSDNLSELEQEKNKYDMMHHKQRRVADWKSQELYDKTNIERYNELKNKYLKDVDNFKDEYDDITLETSISSDGSIHNNGEEYITLQDDPNNENPDYDDSKLKQAIEWSEDTMITMILPTKTLAELEELFIKWKSMIRKHQRDSDNKSIELFGMNSLEHYEYLKNKFIGNDNDEYDKNTVLDISTQAKKIEELRDDVIGNDINESSILDYGLSLLKINNIEPNDLVTSVIKENAIRDIKNKYNNHFDNSYDSLPTQLPYFTYDEIRSRIDDDLYLSYYNNIDNRLNDDITIKKWLDSYSLLCKGIIDCDIQKLIPLWINRVNELCIKLYKEKDELKIQQLKENILLLGWNPEVHFTYENRVKANSRCIGLINGYYRDISIDISKLNIDKDTVLNEQSSNGKLYPIFIVLSYTGTHAARIINKITDSIYSHVAIGLDSTLQNLYSFNANVNGFSLESISKYKSRNPDSMLRVNCVFVHKADFDKIKMNIGNLLSNIKKTSYSFKNLLGILLNKPIQASYSMICSQFVDYVFKSIDVDLTNKHSGLVTPKDFEVIKNSRLYKLFEGNIGDYNVTHVNQLVNTLSKRAIYIKESSDIISESQYINLFFEEYNNLNSLIYLNEKSNLLTGDNKIIFENYIKPYIDIEYYITETKEFPVQFDKDGNLLIKNKRNINFETEYSKSHKLLKIYDETNNLEGMKYELSKLWFLNLLLEEKIYVQKNKDSEEFLKVRARILNDFNKYIKIVSKEDNTFNFTEYYNNTPFSDETVKINNTTLKYSGKILKTIIGHLLH